MRGGAGPWRSGIAGALAEFYRRHWEQWVDAPLPALKGATPRAAAASPARRERLEGTAGAVRTHSPAVLVGSGDFGQGEGQRTVLRLVRQQPAFTLEAARVAGEPAVGARDAMTGYDDRDRVCAPLAAPPVPYFW